MTKRLMIMAAGTGGHIFPGIAIAQTMRARGWDVTWLGTVHGMEKDIVPKHGIAMDSIDFAGMRGKGLGHTVGGAFKLVASFASCRKYLALRKPDVVLGMGGYVTVPGGMMARARGVPLALVNADAALLLSNKTLAPIAQRVLFGLHADFGDNRDKFAGKAVVTGNPVRAEILAMPAPARRFASRSGPLSILVVGGSLGAKVLNDAVPAALALIARGERPVVTHQSGKKNIDALRQRGQGLVRQQQRGVGVHQRQRDAARTRHHPARHRHVAAHAEHHVGLAQAKVAQAAGEAGRHPEGAREGVLQALAAHAREVDHVHRDAVFRHDVLFHAVRRAQPAHFPAALAHGLGDRDTGEDMSAGAGRHDHQALHGRPPRISTRFS